MFKSIHLPAGLALRLAAEDDVRRVKHFDDLVFGAQQGISESEVAEVLRRGAIILLEDSDGALLGESQVLVTQPDFLHLELPATDAFYYGTAIRPDLQGRGIGKLLAKAQDTLARHHGKAAALATVRLENYQSLKMRFDLGFLVVAYLPTFYGTPETNGARLLIRKPLLAATTPLSEHARLPVQFGESPDLLAHAQIPPLFERGLQAFAITGAKDTRGHLVFGR